MSVVIWLVSLVVLYFVVRTAAADGVRDACKAMAEKRNADADGQGRDRWES